ncbi:MAG TPA: histidine phosphatase family protein [Nitrosopumilaceae archaeon]|nr:histidine phosphatase family protein [Nitrosopumilaceae archaeon]
MSLIIFLRHAQAKNNVERILAGRTKGFPLTDLGLQQANNAASFLGALKISAIYSSPIERALNTAQIVSDKLNLNLKVDDRLTEIEMGNFSGMAYEDMFTKHGNVFLKFYQDNPVIAQNGVETFSSVKKRVLDMVNYCSKQHKNQNVLLVTHMDPIKAMLSTILQLKPESLYELIIQNASLNIIKKEQNTFSFVAINSMNADRYSQV